MDALEDRQVSTADALARIEILMQEKLEAEKARKQSGLDPDTFEIFWFLQQQKLPDAMMLATEISAVYQRFPNSASNADEHRQYGGDEWGECHREPDRSAQLHAQQRRAVGIDSREPGLRDRSHPAPNRARPGSAPQSLSLQAPRRRPRTA